MTGEQLYEGWRKAAATLGFMCSTWADLPIFASNAHQKWDEVAKTIDVPALGGGMYVPPSGSFFCGLFNQMPTQATLAVADELVNRWSYYFNFSGQAETSDHHEGDMWLFKASGLKAKVTAVAGSQVCLSINGTETGWIEIEELEKNAKKQ